MEGSPLEQLLAAIDRRDVDELTALFAPQPTVLAADGRRAEGAEAVRGLLESFLAQLRATAHRVTAQWHQDNVWIAEVDADYELLDWLQLNALPRVFVVRMGEGGIADLRVYGAHEQPLTKHRTGEEGTWVGTRWIPPL